MDCGIVRGLASLALINFNNNCLPPATWVNRCSEDLECLDLEDEQPLAQLSAVQAEKMTLFFTVLLDHDRDDVICDQDFDNFFEVPTLLLPK